MNPSTPDDPTIGVPEAGDRDGSWYASSERAGTVIGRYKLVRQIGEGGFGTVYLAEQQEPVRRAVALKIIKPGMDTKQVIARFEAERQALALMDHQSIARVLDAGATEAGRPYFVMELVKGESITTYCDRHNIGIDERLKLLQQVCQAVQHAHHKGIIHRDIKPSNVMITMQDGRPLPKVIDFGIAKATSQRLTERTMFTEHHQFVGTPEYMSPEQAEMNQVDIDTRSDIYSLGVLMYELLTGMTPFDPQQLRGTSYAEIQRIIREETPPRPSTRIISCDKRDSIAAQRKSEPKRLTSLLRDDIDWIVMKAMEKDRTRRYETANGLSFDIARYLKNEPVVAGPPSASYRLRKFVRRHRGPVLAAALVALALVAGLLGTVTFAVRESRQRDLADANAALALKREAEAERIAGFQASVLAAANTQEMGEAILDAFRDQVQLRLERRWVTDDSGHSRPRTEKEIADALAAFDAVAQPADAAEIARHMIDTGVMVPAIASLDEEFADQPLVQAEILQTIGNVYASIGLFEEAVRHNRRVLELRREHGADPALIVESLYHLVWDLHSTGRCDEALVLAREELQLAREHYGESHLAVASALAQLAQLASDQEDHDEAERLTREQTEMMIRLDGEGSEQHIRCLWDLSYHAIERGDFEKGEALAREALRLLETRGEGATRDALTLKHNIAEALVAQGRFEEAEALNRHVLAARRVMLGDRHPGVAYSVLGLAGALIGQGEYGLAEPLAREGLAIWRDAGQQDPPELVDALTDLSTILLERNQPAEAEPLLRELVNILRSRFGNEHAKTIAARQRLADAWTRLGRLDLAESALK